jgi:adiponectin receptor
MALLSSNILLIQIHTLTANGLCRYFGKGVGSFLCLAFSKPEPWLSSPPLHHTPPMLHRSRSSETSLKNHAGDRPQKKNVSAVNMITMKGPATRSKVNAKTVTSREASEWQVGNKYILSGYRKANADYGEVLISLTFLHNETCSIYTHLIGALLLPLAATLLTFSLDESRFLDAASTDYAVLGLYFMCAETCLIFSTLYHLMLSHSQHLEVFWLSMDMLGIVIMIVATLFSGIYFGFPCEPRLRNLHLAIVLSTGTITTFLISNPALKRPRWWKWKVGSFVAFGASSLIPIVHGFQRYGIKYMLLYAGMKWYLLEISFYATGVCLYTFRIPERFAPGKLDIWGSSHQIFHVTVLCGIVAHVAALVQAFTAFNTLDVCQLEGIYKVKGWLR